MTKNESLYQRAASAIASGDLENPVIAEYERATAGYRTPPPPASPTIVDVRKIVDADGIHVTPIWGGVDRPDCFGWSLNDTPRHRVIADRLERAIRAGAAFGPAAIAYDRAGQSFVEADAKIIGRYMDADLKRLGF